MSFHFSCLFSRESVLLHCILFFQLALYSQHLTSFSPQLLSFLKSLELVNGHIHNHDAIYDHLNVVATTRFVILHSRLKNEVMHVNSKKLLHKPLGGFVILNNTNFLFAELPLFRSDYVISGRA